MLLLLSRKWACPVVKLPFRLALHKHSARARQQEPSKLVSGLLCRNTINNATFAFQKVGLSCRETAFSLGASQAFSDGTATGTFETRFGAIVNTAFKFARFCTHNITEQVRERLISLSLSLTHYAHFTTLNYMRRRVGPLDDSPASARPKHARGDLALL